MLGPRTAKKRIGMEAKRIQFALSSPVKVQREMSLLIGNPLCMFGGGLGASSRFIALSMSMSAWLHKQVQPPCVCAIFQFSVA